MRVVDEHRERLALLDRFEAARHAVERADPGCDLVLFQVEQDAGGDGAQDVLDVEAAVQAGLDLDPARAEAGAGGVEDELLGPDLGVVGEAEGDEGSSAAASSSSASRLPQASPTFTAAGGGAAPTNSRRFAS